MEKIKFSAIKFLILFTFGFSLAQTGAKYLVIYHDMFNAAIKPLVEWKTKKGVKAVSVPLTQVGSTITQIKSYIQNAYNTWNPRPEYILLVGSPDLLPSYNFNGYACSDDYYADMTGFYDIELCIGRFHCATLPQCSVMVAKSIGYEKSETMHDSTWFNKATTIVKEDNPPDPYYQADCRYIRNFWQAANYAQIDSFSSTNGNNQNDVINAINDGRAFVVYRGQSGGHWWRPFYFLPDSTDNGYKLPIVVSGTCATMTLMPWETMLGEEFLRAGTVQNPKGAVAFFGTTDISSHVSAQRGTATKGFFQAIYQDSIYILGSITKRAKFILDSLFHNQQSRYMEWNLLGDPELNVWTEIPQLLTVNHETIVFVESTDFSVSISCSGEPIRNALVCVMMDSTIYNYGYTDSTGQITFSFTPQDTGTLQITVTGHNYFPYEGTAIVQIVGISERTTRDAISSTPEIYPNPARSCLVICLPQYADRQNLKVFDASGKLIREVHKVTCAQENKEEVISLKGINPGIYFLRLGKETKKFLVVK